jgi:dienelactone hydrolase
MNVRTKREKVRFISGGTECAAWHYPGTNGACVIMAGGGAVTKEPGTDLFAKRFHEAGFAVLAFDYRRLGESGGQPRQVVRIREQLTDWQAAIGFAATLPEVDSARLAVWGFSLSGGHVFRVAARNPQLAAAIAQTPTADGPAAARNAARHQMPIAMLRLAGRGHRRRARRPGRPPAAAGAAGRRAGDRRAPHDAGRPRRRPGAQPGQQVPGLAAGGRGPLGAAHRVVPARP